MSNGFMKKNLKKRKKQFYNIETNQKIKEKKFQPVKNLLKIKQIPLTGRHTILSALNNKNRKLHYLITTIENYSKLLASEVYGKNIAVILIRLDEDISGSQFNFNFPT